MIGLYPVVKKGMKQFVYESCCPTSHLGTTMSGYFLFRYLEGDKKDQEFKAFIEPFVLDIEEGVQLIDNPYWTPELD